MAEKVAVIENERILKANSSNIEITNVLLADGTIPLTADWDIGAGRKIKVDRISARISSFELLGITYICNLAGDSPGMEIGRAHV